MTDAGRPVTLKVATWNVHEGVPVRPGSDPARELARFLAGVDLVALQEVALTPNGGFAEGGPLAGTGLNHRVTFPMSASAMFADRRMGVAILSRWPCREARRVVLPNPDLRATAGGREFASHDKGLLAVQVQVGDRALWFATVHVFPFHKFNRDPRDPAFGKVWQELADSVDALQKLPGRPVLIGGDFNTEHRELLTGRLAGRWRRGVTGATTYRRIESDDVIYSSELELRGTRVIPTFSDHDLCVCEFVLQAPAAAAAAAKSSNARGGRPSARGTPS
jgi:endonuclease/exonuclease/phosphatase family metal-dependent hydrolase